MNKIIIEEAEANAFATALLMPAELVESELEAMWSDHNNLEGLVEALATRFQVTEVRMMARLTQLGLLQHKAV